MDDIRQANRLYTNTIHGREHLIIPGVPGLPKFTEDPPDEMKMERERQRKLKRFQVATKCIEPAEAAFYMDANGHDVDAAITQYHADLAWEKAHPLQKAKHGRPGAAAARTASAPNVTAAGRSSSAAAAAAGVSASQSSSAAFNLFAPIASSSSSSSSASLYAG